jgi:hypothetical protein
MITCPAIGSVITVNVDVEFEEEDGTLHYVAAGQELTVTGHDHGTLTPEKHWEEWGYYSLQVEAGDVPVHVSSDRSGQSDYYVHNLTSWVEVDGETTYELVK